MAVVGCAVRRVSAPGIALANAQCADGPAGVLSGRALPPGAGLGNAQMDQLVAGTAAAGGGRSQMADGEGDDSPANRGTPTCTEFGNGDFWTWGARKCT